MSSSLRSALQMTNDDSKLNPKKNQSMMLICYNYLIVESEERKRTRAAMVC